IPRAEDSAELFAFTWKGQQLTWTRLPQGFPRSPTRTAGSAGVDVTTAASATIVDQKVHKVPLAVRGPLGDGLSALLVGRSSATSQELFVLVGVVDADFTGQIQAMIWTPSPPVFIPMGSRIAQLIPFRSLVPHAESNERGNGGFGSTGVHPSSNKN
uniref:dUTPase-like domain-containing protein n=1 Tax=Apteryx owenii TaxID=8824 RepID=A0A8B9PL11_APTOW